jgi:hypothetical protein
VDLERGVIVIRAGKTGEIRFVHLCMLVLKSKRIKEGEGGISGEGLVDCHPERLSYRQTARS